MPIANVSSLYQRIAKGSEGGHEFARFVKLLLRAHYEKFGKKFVSESDASGDFKKVDAYIGHPDFEDLMTGFQFKFYPGKLSASQKKEIVKSIEAAINHNKYIHTLILVTPEDWQKDQLAWFDEIKKKFNHTFEFRTNRISGIGRFKLEHWGHTRIVELALRFDFLGIHYFKELFPIGVGKFKLNSCKIDSKACCWLPSRYNINQFYSEKGTNSSHLTTDPIFDFQFKNSTAEIHLLKSIEIHVEDTWSTLKGFPADQLLTSIGIIEIEIDYKTKLSTYVFDDPLIFEAGKAKRFQIQLTNFLPCPGNWARIKFLFFFDEITILTDSLEFNI